MKWSRWVFQLQQIVWVSDRVAAADRLKENDQMSALKSGTLQDKNVPVSERRSWRKVSKAHYLINGTLVLSTVAPVASFSFHKLFDQTVLFRDTKPSENTNKTEYRKLFT